MSLYRFVLLLLILPCIFISSAGLAQEEDSYGRIVSMSDNTVSVNFENKTVGLGEEVEIWRFKKIVDPVTGDVKGQTKNIIAKGVVDDIGVGKVQVTVTEMLTGDKITLTDRVLATGKGKQMVRTQKIGSIQELKDDGGIVIDLGADDEISQGDEFLVQRLQTTIDPETKQMTVTNQVDVGRGRVQSVNKKQSVGSLVELLPDMEIQKTDKVVFNKLMKEESVPIAPGITVVDSLKKDIRDLQHKVALLKATVDSLGREHSIFKQEIETVVSQLMTGDIKGTRILLKNNEPIKRSDSREAFEAYKKALDTCLNRKFKPAIELFNSFMNRFPDSKLTENCRYWIAQSYFSMGYYETAIEGFKAVINDKRFTHKDDDASIMTGISYYKLGKHDEALNEFRNFVQFYPSSEYRKIVDRWIKQLST